MANYRGRLQTQGKTEGKSSILAWAEPLRFILPLLICISFAVPYFYAQEAQALVPSLGSVDDDGYILDYDGNRVTSDVAEDYEFGAEDDDEDEILLWTHVVRDKSEQCPGDTTSEMAIGEIIGILVASGLFGGIAVLAGMLIAATALIASSIPIIEGIKVACPLPNPEYPGEAAYWDHPDVKNKIVFRYSPCIGILELTGEFKEPLDNGENYGEDAFLGFGEYGGYFCAGWRIGDGLEMWGPDEENYHEGAILGTTTSQDRICLYVNMLVSDMQIVCQYLEPSPEPLPPAAACFMPRACGDDSFSDQLYPPGISARIVQCVEGSVRALFEEGFRTSDGTYYPDPASGTQNCPITDFSSKFQREFKRAITGLLTLYVIFYGMKIAFGVEQSLNKGEFMLKMITFSLVSYFAIGDAWDTYFPALVTVSNALAGMVMDASTGGYYCSFPIDGYPDENAARLRLWDTMDCKFFTYFSVNKDYPKLFTVGFYTFFGGGVVILIFGVLLGIFIIGLMFFAIQIYLASLIGIAILVFVSPLLIPMALFEPTRKYFDGWLNAMIAFAIYPVVLFGFLALLLVSMDIFYWGEPRVGDAAGRNEKNEWRYLPSSSAQPFRCGNTGIGYDSLHSCRENCKGGECRLDQSLLELPPDGMYLCPATMHIFEGDNAASRCSDQCYQEIDMDDDRALRMSTGYLAGTIDETYDPPRQYRDCVNGNYKPEFKARCTDFDGGPLYLTKEECEKPSNCTNNCKYECDDSTFGCQLYRADYGEGDGDVPGFAMHDFSMGTALLALLKVVGIGVLFFYYLSIIGPMIASLVGSHKLNVSELASNPQAVMKGIGAMTTGAATLNLKGVIKGAKQVDNA